jgi:ParB family transcriptional regulator, chromosome partitioning protein
MNSNQSFFNPAIPGIIERILLSKLHHSRFLLRDIKHSMEELQASIDEKGLLHPIVVRVDGNGYEIVAGNRRFAACKQLGWKSITCHIMELDDKNAFETSLIENLQHRTLNAVEEAFAYKKYIEEYGWGGVSELAKKVGKSHSYVSNRIRLLELPQDILDKIVCRQTNPSIAQEILAVEDQGKRESLIREIISYNLTRKEVRELVRNNRQESNSDFLTNPFAPTKTEKELHEKEKIILHFIAAFRVALMRLDDILDGFEKEDWILWDNLMYHRRTVHKQIDELIILKKKVKCYINNIEHINH